MPAKEVFDFLEFVTDMKAQRPENVLTHVGKEVVRVNEMFIRDPEMKFQQQLYIRRLERLVRCLAGKDVSQELSPVEVKAYEVLGLRPTPLAAQEKASVASGADRRTSRRITLKTRVRIRRDGGHWAEVLEPENVSRGGIGFQSKAHYRLDEIVWLKMHFEPDAPKGPGMETRSIIVRAVPQQEEGVFSYGVKFLGT